MTQEGLGGGALTVEPRVLLPDLLKHETERGLKRRSSAQRTRIGPLLLCVLLHIAEFVRRRIH